MSNTQPQAPYTDEPQVPETKEISTPNEAKVSSGPKYALTMDERRTVFEEALGDAMSIDRFMAVAKKHIGESEKLQKGFHNNPRQVMSAMLEAATDGLLLDGKHAALVPFWDSKARSYSVTYMPMIRGIIHRMHNTGKIDSMNVKLVYTGDTFVHTEGDSPSVKHEPKYSSDDVTHAYAVVWIKGSKHPYIDVMKKSELDVEESNAIRKVGGTDKKFRTPWGGPYKGEMQRKTVLKRLSKYLPLSAEEKLVFERDNQFIDLGDDELEYVPEKTIKPLRIKMAEPELEAPQTPPDEDGAASDAEAPEPQTVSLDTPIRHPVFVTMDLFIKTPNEKSMAQVWNDHLREADNCPDLMSEWHMLQEHEAYKALSDEAKKFIGGNTKKRFSALEAELGV